MALHTRDCQSELPKGGCASCQKKLLANFFTVLHSLINEKTCYIASETILFYPFTFWRKPLSKRCFVPAEDGRRTEIGIATGERGWQDAMPTTTRWDSDEDAFLAGFLFMTDYSIERIVEKRETCPDNPRVCYEGLPTMDSLVGHYVFSNSRGWTV